MILSKDFNLEESLLFSIAVRETLCLLVDKSNVSFKTELKLFVINEATNYQIMSLLLDGYLPSNKFNDFDELVLFERIRLEVKENKDFICELFGTDIFDDVTKKIDSVGSKFSNIKSLLEAMSNKDFFDVGSRPIKPSKYKIDPKTQKMLDVGKKASDKYHGSFDLKPKYDVSSPDVIDKIKSVPKVVPKVIPKPTVKPKPVIQHKTDSLVQTKKAVEVRAKIDKAFDTLKDRASSGVNAATSFVKAHPAEISGVLLAVLAIYVSTKIYKRFYSKAAKSCSTYKGSKKTICMKKFQISGYKAQLVDLKKAVTQCGLTKNPEKCVKTIKKKIDKKNKKISKAI